MTSASSTAAARALRQVSLDDKYALDAGTVYMSGTQALVRLPLLQRARDRAQGLNTAGFVSGYRGSPLGGLDHALWGARRFLDAADVRFQPGVNEELAATSIWGTQQIALRGRGTVDGVFSMWYGKGPGVDRAVDAFKHANAAGTHPRGGVLALAGDDHAAKSSTLAHQSDHIFKACGIPVLFPASVQEILDLGLHGWAMSRYTGLWVGVKCISDVVESSASVQVDPARVRIALPQDFVMPPGGLNIRWPDPPLEQEARLLDHKLYAALAYVRANRLNYSAIDPPQARFGIIACGKAFLDTLQALQELGLDQRACMELGIRVHKVGMVWPLEAALTREFAQGLQEILVVEEKRQLIEYALKEELYNWRADVRPRVVGKFDERDGGEYAEPRGDWLLPARSELSPVLVARAIAARLQRLEIPADLRARLQAYLREQEARGARLAAQAPTEARLPYYCSGCPHNTSTHVPEGSRALAGIGCHYMATWMPERSTYTFTQMGGEGAPWIGQAPYTDEPHVFANLGDGTYFHSGILAVRAAVAAGVNITYKILYNDAVAMTGGQPVDGTMTVPQVAQQLLAEGVRRVVVVTDEPGKYATRRGWAAGTEPVLPPGVDLLHRREMDAIQRQLRDTPGCTALIYDQTCATEKRRRRKRIVGGKPAFPDPPKRMFINDAVCEGCGDCSVQSSCLSVEPLETDWGRKRVINQSTCNKDYSCVNGFCPSFVTVKGGSLRKSRAAPVAAGWGDLPEPRIPDAASPFAILVTGVGGTGVVTIGQLLGMAAHLEGKGVSTLDMTGIAQKGGAVLSHVKIADDPARLTAPAIAGGGADALIACDIVVAAGREALSRMAAARTRAVVNAALSPTANFLRDRDWSFPLERARAAIGAAAGGGDGSCRYVDAAQLAERLFGDLIAANPLMLGYAWQQGLIPLGREALLRAIELNAVAVAMNQAAFEWGRRAAHDLDKVMAHCAPAPLRAAPPKSLDELVESRRRFLTEYQDAAYAERYAALVSEAAAAEARLPGATGLAEAVARNYAKLLACKDEYEVARLHADPRFRKKLEATFEGPYTLEFNLAPPLLSRRNAKGELVKRPFGPWMMTAFRLLARLKFLRGTPLDFAGYTQERRRERQLVANYERLLREIVGTLSAANHATAVELAAIPDAIRGYGHVKERAMDAAAKKEAELLQRYRTAGARQAAAAEPAAVS
ncbi:MAG: indolepyruvate ferredoxin oxidoreductase family protein [Nevskia sp.]|nr:indolepyruvate ferredoxin oxidoreductase family protein [Nevskia sp.]